jgi:hypothetical protein
VTHSKIIGEKPSLLGGASRARTDDDGIMS